MWSYNFPNPNPPRTSPDGPEPYEAATGQYANSEPPPSSHPYHNWPYSAGQASAPGSASPPGYSYYASVPPPQTFPQGSWQTPDSRPHASAVPRATPPYSMRYNNVPGPKVTTGPYRMRAESSTPYPQSGGWQADQHQSPPATSFTTGPAADTLRTDPSPGYSTQQGFEYGTGFSPGYNPQFDPRRDPPSEKNQGSSGTPRTVGSSTRGNTSQQWQQCEQWQQWKQWEEWENSMLEQISDRLPSVFAPAVKQGFEELQGPYNKAGKHPTRLDDAWRPKILEWYNRLGRSMKACRLRFKPHGDYRVWETRHGLTMVEQDFEIFGLPTEGKGTRRRIEPTLLTPDLLTLRALYAPKRVEIKVFDGVSSRNAPNCSSFRQASDTKSGTNGVDFTAYKNFPRKGGRFPGGPERRV